MRLFQRRETTEWASEQLHKAIHHVAVSESDWLNRTKHLAAALEAMQTVKRALDMADGRERAQQGIEEDQP